MSEWKCDDCGATNSDGYECRNGCGTHGPKKDESEAAPL